MGCLHRSHIETDVFFTVAMDADYVIWDAESRLEERLAKVEKAIGRMADFEARLKWIEGKIGKVDSTLKWIDDREDVMEERQGILDERLAATNVVHDNLDEWQGELNSRLSGLEDYLGMPHNSHQMIVLEYGQ